MDVLPDVPTFTEIGLTGLELGKHPGIVTPSVTSKENVKEMISCYRGALQELRCIALSVDCCRCCVTQHSATSISERHEAAA